MLADQMNSATLRAAIRPVFSATLITVMSKTPTAENVVGVRGDRNKCQGEFDLMLNRLCQRLNGIRIAKQIEMDRTNEGLKWRGDFGCTGFDFIAQVLR